MLTVFCLMRWVWGNDHHIPHKQVDVGADIVPDAQAMRQSD